MAFDQPPMTADDIMAAAENMDSTTLSIDIYNLIASALRLPQPPEALPAALVAATGLTKAQVEIACRHIAQHLTYSRTTEIERLALDALERHYGFGLLTKVAGDGTLYTYQRTHWAEAPVQGLRKKLTTMALQRPMVYGAAKSSVGPAIQLIKDIAPPADDFMLSIPRPVVNTRNKEIWILEGGKQEVRIHRPESGLRYVLPVNFNADATSPIFDEALEGILSKAEEPQELQRHLFELMGYAVQGVRDIPVIGFFCGAGANGKSLLLGVLKAIAGRQQVLAGTLGSVTRDRFMLPDLAGKLLFVEDDAKDDVELEDGLLKMVSENKIINSRRVRASHGMAFCSMVMPLISTNNAPRLRDTSDGMRRRLHVIPFDRQFTRQEIDPDLGRKIDGELSGVLNHLLDGLSRLRERGCFDPPKDCERAKEAFLAAANPLMGFLEERCIPSAGARIGLRDLYQAYTTWLKQGGQRPDLTLRSFKPKLQAMGIQVIKSSSMVVMDIALRETA